MTHINELPPELLSTVFLIIIGLSKEDITPLTERRSHKLLHILLVCRYWNSAACATPSLWTTAFVTSGSTAVQRVQRYLERSGDLPLDVVITFKTVNVQNTEDALQILAGHSARWRSFSTAWATFRMNRILEITFPNLSTFSYSHARSLHQSSPSLTLDAPKLKTLIALIGTASFKNNSWPNLSHLDIQWPQGYEIWLWKVLGASQSSLEFMGMRSETTLRIRKGIFEADNGNGSAVSCLPKLRCLEVCALSDDQWGSLRLAAMPSLTHLTLDFNFLPPLQDSQLLLPTFNSLQFLHLCTYPRPNCADTLSIFLERAPNVTSLMITNKVPGFSRSEEYLLTPLLLPAAASPQEPLVGKKLEEVHLLGLPASVEKLKKLVDLRLRAGWLKKIVLTKGWNVAQLLPNINPEQDLVWLKSRVVLEEVEEEE